MNLMKIFILIIIFTLSASCHEEKEFNSDEWKNWRESESTMQTRWLMHKDLLDSYQLKGVSKDSILKLLGYPNFRQDNEFRYSLGPTDIGINTGTLIIIFKNNIVKKIEVING